MKATATSCALLALVALSGCAVRTITWNGVSYKLSSFGVSSKIGEVEFKQGTNSLKVTGYQSDQVQALGVVAEKAVSAAVKAAKP